MLLLEQLSFSKQQRKPALVVSPSQVHTFTEWKLKDSSHFCHVLSLSGNLLESLVVMSVYLVTVHIVID